MTWLLTGVLFAGLLTAWIPARWPASVIEVGAFAAAMLCLARRPQRWNSMLLAPALLSLWGLVQIVLGWAVAPGAAEHAVLYWAAVLAWAYACFQALSPPRFYRVLFAFGLALSVVSTLQLHTAGGRVFWLFEVADPVFMMGPFANHNHYAAFVEMLLPLAFMVPRSRWARIAAGAALVATVIASASRSGAVLVSLEFAMLVLLSVRGERRRMRTLLAAGAVAALLAAAAGWQPLAERMRQGEANDARLQMLRSTLDMIRDHPVRGVGMGNWPVVYPAYARYDDGLYANQAHNDWAQWIAEGGIAGLGAALLLAACAWRAALRGPAAIGVVFVMLHALVDYPFHKLEITAMAFALLACAINDSPGALRDRPES